MTRRALILVVMVLFVVTSAVAQRNNDPATGRDGRIADYPRFVSITIDGGTICGIDQERQAWCWGRGWLGDGSDGASHQSSRTPSMVEGPRAYVMIDAGSDHTCAVDADGNAWCWGRNGNGALGDGTRFFHYFVRSPRAVNGDRTYRAITADSFGTCALDEDGRLYCWGGTDDGLLNIGPQSVSWEPVAYFEQYRWKQINVRFTTICGVTAEGQGLCWGTTGGYVLGNGEFGGKDTPTPVGGNQNWQKISQGSSHACALDEDGQVWCWGSGSLGQLGHDGDGECMGALSECSTVPMPIETDARFVDIASGGTSTCALDVQGRIWCWGDGKDGTLADGDFTRHHRQRPQPIETNLRFSALALEARTVCGVEQSTGYVWCWGPGANPEGGSAGEPMLVPPPGGFLSEPEQASEEPGREVDREDVQQGAQKLFDFLRDAVEETEESSKE